MRQKKSLAETVCWCSVSVICLTAAHVAATSEPKVAQGGLDDKAKQRQASIDRSSPGSVFRARQQAAAEADWETEFQCLTPTRQKEWLADIIIHLSEMADKYRASPPADDESFRRRVHKWPFEYESTIDGYGLDPISVLPKAVRLAGTKATVQKIDAAIKHKAACYAEITSSFAWRFPTAFGKIWGAPEEWKELTISNVKIRGDKATATVTGTLRGEFGRYTHSFERWNGGWYMAH